MKLLLRQNNHIKKEQDDCGYGCVCSKCGSQYSLSIEKMHVFQDVQIQIQDIVW